MGEVCHPRPSRILRLKQSRVLSVNIFLHCARVWGTFPLRDSQQKSDHRLLVNLDLIDDKSQFLRYTRVLRAHAHIRMVN